MPDANGLLPPQPGGDSVRETAVREPGGKGARVDRISPRRSNNHTPDAAARLFTDAISARERFPRGLIQPLGSFRFSADALLLAAFAVRRCLPDHGPERAAPALLDLGCGCGVVALACLLACPSLRAVGVDIQSDLAAAARENAALLGLETRFAAHAADITAQTPPYPPGSFAVAAANMPYRRPGSGRLPRSAARKAALFAEENTIPAFLSAAASALATGGNLALVYPWDERDILLSALPEHGFSPQEILPVSTGTATGSRCLLRAMRAGEESRKGGGPLILPPLALHQEKGTSYTEEALAFCPWLDSRPWT